MKISRIELVRLELPLEPPFPAAWDPEPRRSFRATLVLVETDEGIRGIGSGDSMEGFEPYAGLFIGKDPLAIARHVRSLETISFHGGRPWPLEAALWDIAGKVAGQPVARLLGGFTDSMPVYASTGAIAAPGERADIACELWARGFKAMKIRIDPARLREGIDSVVAVRERLADMTLMVDVNQGWRMPGDTRPSIDRVEALTIARRLADHGVLWLEEPLDGADTAGLAALRQSSPVRIAGGEMARTYTELLGLVEADALDVYQPDVVLAGGISRVRTLAEHVLAKGRWFSPHTWSNGIGLLANLHVAAGVGGGPFLEYPLDPPTWVPERRDFMLAEPVVADKDGRLPVPCRPGLGVELDEEALRRYRLG